MHHGDARLDVVEQEVDVRRQVLEGNLENVVGDAFVADGVDVLAHQEFCQPVRREAFAATPRPDDQALESATDVKRAQEQWFNDISDASQIF